ncbi:hypothetical protein C8J57DRAFT_610741 [Mycena rebaudengoi]|nr:hypothetical protein C8J57DRAFT_610741 [Mycena rebaudengoi]
MRPLALRPRPRHTTACPSTSNAARPANCPLPFAHPTACLALLGRLLLRHAAALHTRVPCGQHTIFGRPSSLSSAAPTRTSSLNCTRPWRRSSARAAKMPCRSHHSTPPRRLPRWFHLWPTRKYIPRPTPCKIQSGHCNTRSGAPDAQPGMRNDGDGKKSAKCCAVRRAMALLLVPHVVVVVVVVVVIIFRFFYRVKSVCLEESVLSAGVGLALLVLESATESGMSTSTTSPATTRAQDVEAEHALAWRVHAVLLGPAGDR